MSRLVDRTAMPSQLGSTGSVGFETVKVSAAYHARFLKTGGRRAYEVGNGCGTCAFWFTRLEGANGNVSVDEIRGELAAGLKGVSDPTVGAFAQVLEPADYVVLLLDVLPTLTQPADPNGYFAKEEVDLWGLDDFWGVPHFPRVPYYRLPDTAVGTDARLFEFVVPMYPSTWLEPATVQGYAMELARGAMPTAVAISVLDVKQPSDWVEGTEITSHWCLAHYLLDGHHKFHAAAAERRPVRLLSFLAVDAGVSSRDDIESVLRLA